MARDRSLLDRMYGVAPPRRVVGVVPALWLAGLLAAGAGSAVVAAISAALLASGAAVDPLVRAGVLGPEERVWAFAEAGADGGCALVGRGELVRWAGGAPDGRLDLRGGHHHLDGDRFVAERDGRRLDCAVGDQAEAFMAAAAALARQPDPRRSKARDPRVDAFRGASLDPHPPAGVRD